MAPLSGGLDGGDVELDLDLVANEDAAPVERDVEGEAEVLAADGGPACEAGAVVAPRVLLAALELQGQVDRAGDVLDGQVAAHDVLVAVLDDLRAGEGQGGELLDVQEIRAADVCVAVGDAAVEALRPDRDGRA